MDDAEIVAAWRFLPWGYVLTVLIETSILWFGLSPRHTPGRRLAAGLWLSACTYPIVILSLPVAMYGASRAAYLVVAETFAPLAECLLFRWAFDPTTGSSSHSASWRDAAAIVAANLASFLAGELGLVG